MRLRRELAYLAGFYFVWQYAVWLSGRQAPGPALAHGRWLWHVEALAHVNVEPQLQRAAGAVPGLTWALTGYYELAHVLVMVAALVWAWRRGPAVYRPFRTVLAGVTGVAFVVQLWQVAPLRVLGVGVVDAALQRGVSVYELAHSRVDQFSAFPSLHVGWAVVVAWAALKYGRTWVARVCAWHAALTIAAVVVTGNHSLVDCAAGVLLVVVVVQVMERRQAGARGRGLHRERGRHRLAGVPALDVAGEAA